MIKDSRGPVKKEGESHCIKKAHKISILNVQGDIATKDLKPQFIYFTFDLSTQSLPEGNVQFVQRGWHAAAVGNNMIKIKN